MVGSAAQIFDDSQYLSFSEIIVGIGCFGAWICTLKYMDFFSNFSKTVGKSLFPVGKAFIGVLPIFIGANFLAICLFWRSERFGSFSDGLFTLFSVMNGDNLAAVY